MPNEIPDLSSESISKAIELLKRNITIRISRHGKICHANTHESLGIVTEEFHELVDAVKKNGVASIIREMMDVSVGALIGVASIFERWEKIDAVEKKEK